MTNCGEKFRMNKHDYNMGAIIRCTRPSGHQGRHAASMFYQIKRWGAPLPEGCIRLESILEPANGYEARVHDSIVDMVTKKQVWA